MRQYKVLVIYIIANGQLEKSFEEELEKYGLERVGEQGIFALPFRGISDKGTGIQSLPANLRAQAFGQSGHRTVR